MCSSFATPHTLLMQVVCSHQFFIGAGVVLTVATRLEEFVKHAVEGFALPCPATAADAKERLAIGWQRLARPVVLIHEKRVDAVLGKAQVRRLAGVVVVIAGMPRPSHQTTSALSERNSTGMPDFSAASMPYLMPLLIPMS